MKKLLALFLTSFFALSGFAVDLSKELSLALDTTNLVWDTGGDHFWSFQTETTHDGVAALRSGSIQDLETSWIEVSTTNSGLLTYLIKISSETNSDFLRVYLNGIEDASLTTSGEVDWIEKTIVVPPGTNTLRWVYAKDAISISGNDCVWMDEVSLVPIPLVHITAVPTNTVWALGGTVSGSGYYESNSTVVVEAVPDPYHSISWWYFDSVQVSGATPNPYSFTAISDRVIAVQFKPDFFSVSLSANPTNGGTVARSGYRRYGTTETNTATSVSGYVFSHWSEGGTNVSNAATYVYTLLSDRTLVANFAPSYTVSTSSSPSGSGSTSGGGTYTSGTSCTVVATPNTGYVFSSWKHSGTNVSTSASYTFNVNAARALVAVFTLNSYTISTSSSPTAGGSTSGGGTYDYGESCTVVASRNPGYSFVNWTVSATPVSTAASYGFTVSGSKALVAGFSYNLPLADAVDSLLTYSTGGDGGYPAGSTSWYRQTTSTHDGVDAARSGPIGDAGISYLQTSVSGPGTISFWWWIDNLDNTDTLKFYVDDIQKGQTELVIVGQYWTPPPWRYVSISVTGLGAHALKWEYAKSFNGGFLSDAGYVDQIVWTPD